MGNAEQTAIIMGEYDGEKASPDHLETALSVVLEY